MQACEVIDKEIYILVIAVGKSDKNMVYKKDQEKNTFR
jgi:hypothetical protein